MQDNAQEYHNLIRDSLAFLQHSLCPEAFFISSEKGQIETPTVSLPVEEPSKPTEVSFAKTSTPPIKKSSWELHPMLPVENVSFFYKKLTPFVPIQELNIPICLILAKEDASHRLFLENVSRAVTRHFAPSCVLNYTEALFGSAQNKLLLAPVELLKKRFPECSPHKLLKTHTFSIFVLYSLDKYIEDMHCKRTLWTALQSLFQS